MRNSTEAYNSEFRIWIVRIATRPLRLGARAASSHCDANHVCDATGASINHSARTLGNAGTIIGGVGLAAIAAGVVLYVTAPAASEHLSLAPSRDGVTFAWGSAF